MIRKTAAVALTALLSVGCQDSSDRCELTDTCPFPDLGVPDLAPLPPKCAAAKGLSGDTLLCVDFKDLKDQILIFPISDLPDWKVDGQNRWEIASGKLQVKNFGSFVGTCSFTMPLTDLAAAANQKYQSVTLAVVQRVDLNPVSQKAQMMLGLDDPTTRLIDETRGTQPTQQRVYAVQKVALPNGGGAAYQPLFKLTSGALYAGVGWQIESIAVMGNP